MSLDFFLFDVFSRDSVAPVISPFFFSDNGEPKPGPLHHLLLRRWLGGALCRARDTYRPSSNRLLWLWQVEPAESESSPMTMAANTSRALCSSTLTRMKRTRLDSLLSPASLGSLVPLHSLTMRKKIKTASPTELCTVWPTDQINSDLTSVVCNRQQVEQQSSSPGTSNPESLRPLQQVFVFVSTATTEESGSLLRQWPTSILSSLSAVAGEKLPPALFSISKT